MTDLPHSYAIEFDDTAMRVNLLGRMADGSHRLIGSAEADFRVRGGGIEEAVGALERLALRTATRRQMAPMLLAFDAFRAEIASAKSGNPPETNP